MADDLPQEAVELPHVRHACRPAVDAGVRFDLVPEGLYEARLLREIIQRVTDHLKHACK